MYYNKYVRVLKRVRGRNGDFVEEHVRVTKRYLRGWENPMEFYNEEEILLLFIIYYLNYSIHSSRSTRADDIRRKIATARAPTNNHAQPKTQRSEY